jgi:hypothetical protein
MSNDDAVDDFDLELALSMMEDDGCPNLPPEEEPPIEETPEPK